MAIAGPGIALELKNGYHYRLRYSFVTPVMSAGFFQNRRFLAPSPPERQIARVLQFDVDAPKEVL